MTALNYFDLFYMNLNDKRSTK